MNPATVLRVLDAAAARPLLAAVCPDAAHAAIELESVWAKPGRHCNACWMVGRGDRAMRVSLVPVRPDEAARAMRHAARHAAPGSAVLAEADVLAQRFPFDLRLPTLAGAVEPAAARAVEGCAAVDAATPVAYRAGMRCQVRFDAGGRPLAYGKVAVEREPGRRRDIHRWMERETAATTMRVPRHLGSHESLGLEFAAAVGGRSLHDALAAGDDADAVATASAALAELRAAVAPPPWRLHFAADELDLLASWTAWMESLDQELGAAMRHALGGLASSRPAPGPPSFAHRDFHDRQVLLDDGRLWLLDVDTACTGDRELDAGNLLAHLFLRGLQWERRHAFAALAARTLAASGPGLRLDAVEWYRRATLARLAGVYRLRPRWSALAPALAAEAGRP